MVDLYHTAERLQFAAKLMRRASQLKDEMNIEYTLDEANNHLVQAMQELDDIRGYIYAQQETVDGQHPHDDDEEIPF